MFDRGYRNKSGKPYKEKTRESHILAPKTRLFVVPLTSVARIHFVALFAMDIVTKLWMVRALTHSSWNSLFDVRVTCACRFLLVYNHVRDHIYKLRGVFRLQKDARYEI